MVGLSGQARIFLWLMSMHRVNLVISKRCGTRCPHGCRRWEGWGCACAGTSRQSGASTRDVPQELGSAPRIILFLTVLLMITSSWTCRFVVASSPGTEGTTSRWAAWIGFCYLKSGVFLGPTACIWRNWGVCQIIVLLFWCRMRRIGDLDPCGC
jgi:hypothetical protein